VLAHSVPTAPHRVSRCADRRGARWTSFTWRHVSGPATIPG